jgi:hypothetical protein
MDDLQCACAVLARSARDVRRCIVASVIRSSLRKELKLEREERTCSHTRDNGHLVVTRAVVRYRYMFGTYGRTDGHV